MASIEAGVVRSIYRYPVKSMLGESLDRARIDRGGVLGDRQYALVDDETGKVVSVKRPKRWARMFELSARTSGDTVKIHFPDGGSLPIGDPELRSRLSDFFERSVSVVSTPPPDATFEEVWVRELKNDADPYLGMPSRIEDGDEMIDGGQFMNATGRFFNGPPIHVVTTSTTRHLSELAPASRFDPHRFRPNIVLETGDTGFIENTWAGNVLRVGDVQLRVSMAVPRCVMTTLAQADLPADTNVLRTISRHNAIDLGLGSPSPCVGVYADVASHGEIAVGMSAALDEPNSDAGR